VTDSTAGTGISGATITIVDGPNASKSPTTDRSGGYSLSGLPKPQQQLRLIAGRPASPSPVSYKKVGRRYVVVGRGVVMVSPQSKGMRLTDLGLLVFALTPSR
jgi:hypothetical protein